MPDRWQDRWFTGHRTWRKVTIYGANAMHWAINIRTRCGTFCFHPTTRTFGGRWPWYAYLSPNATPWAATWGVGPGFDGGKRATEWRRKNLGHGFYSELLSYEEMQPPEDRPLTESPYAD